MAYSQTAAAHELHTGNLHKALNYAGMHMQKPTHACPALSSVPTTALWHDCKLQSHLALLFQLPCLAVPLCGWLPSALGFWPHLGTWDSFPCWYLLHKGILSGFLSSDGYRELDCIILVHMIKISACSCLEIRSLKRPSRYCEAVAPVEQMPL